MHSSLSRSAPAPDNHLLSLYRFDNLFISVDSNMAFSDELLALSIVVSRLIHLLVL